eukprot:1388324-Amphidinium_carterae.2
MAAIWIWLPHNCREVEPKGMRGQRSFTYTGKEVEVYEWATPGAGYPSWNWGPALSLLHVWLG